MRCVGWHCVRWMLHVGWSETLDALRWMVGDVRWSMTLVGLRRCNVKHQTCVAPNNVKHKTPQAIQRETQNAAGLPTQRLKRASHLTTMLITLIRRYNTEQTDGRLLIDGKLFCTTIEPPRGFRSTPPDSLLRKADYLASVSKAEQNKPCCIPEGWYRVEVTLSPRFERPMPLLQMVPGFSGIRIHAGLSVRNTTGCICVGYRDTEERLTRLLTQTQNRHEEIYIAIYPEHEPDDNLDEQLPQQSPRRKSSRGTKH